MTPAEEDALVESCYVDCAKACVGPLIYLDKTLDEPAIRLAIRAAVAAERERAAGIADDMAHGYSHGLTREEYEVLTDCAAAIRRGE